MSKFRLLRFLSKYFSLSTLRKILGFLPYYVKGLFHRMNEHHIFLSGGGIAFSLLLSIFPIILLVFSILGNVINPATIQTQISQLIDTIIPYPQYAAYAKKVIMSRLPGVIEYKTLAGYTGALGLFFTSTWLFSSMTTILNKVYKVEDTKGIWVGLLRDVGMVILVIFLILLSTFIFPTLNVIIGLAKDVPVLRSLKISSLFSSLISITSVIIIFTLFSLFYALIPHTRLGRKVVFISAIWTTFLWEVARKLFGLYVTNFLSSNHVYGAFLLIVVVLFWLFYTSIIFILGAEIGQLYRERIKSKEKEKNDMMKKINPKSVDVI
ncbi:hypothetical protein BMS3Abin04_01124 [bacterium BMS3Abin04]|nr:hypothetical protein BMS3Abin04_01124 [bacterium BMS3Abin04]